MKVGDIVVALRPLWVGGNNKEPVEIKNNGIVIDVYDHIVDVQFPEGVAGGCDSTRHVKYSYLMKSPLMKAMK